MNEEKDLYQEFQCLDKTIRVVMHSDYTYEEFINENGELIPINFLQWVISEKKKQNAEKL